MLQPPAPLPPPLDSLVTAPRRHTHQQARILTPGQLPGFNIEAVKVGSAVLSTGDVL